MDSNVTIQEYSYLINNDIIKLCVWIMISMKINIIILLLSHHSCIILIFYLDPL